MAAAGALWVLLVNLCVIHLRTVQTFDDKFSEELYIKRLPNSYLYTHFQFTTVSKTRSTITGKEVVERVDKHNASFRVEGCHLAHL